MAPFCCTAFNLIGDDDFVKTKKTLKRKRPETSTEEETVSKRKALDHVSIESLFTYVLNNQTLNILLPHPEKVSITLKFQYFFFCR